MNIWRYQIRESLKIAAPVEHVYTLASAPEFVPRYAQDVVRIEPVKRLSEHQMLAWSFLRVAGVTLRFLYRYHYRPPAHYSGVQEAGSICRGFFTFNFSSQGHQTIVSHTEGFTSSLPLFAGIIGFIYFRVIARDSLQVELGRLKELVESVDYSKSKK